MRTLRRDRIPDFLETVNHIEELAGDIIHGITLGASVSPRPTKLREPAGSSAPRRTEESCRSGKSTVVGLLAEACGLNPQ
jgi:hypothetical protein